MNLEEQIKLHKELSHKINELEEQKQILGTNIMDQMASKTLKVPGYIVKKISRLSIKLSIDEARLHGAVKLEETIDRDQIKLLYHGGQAINGVTETHYIQISES